MLTLHKATTVYYRLKFILTLINRRVQSLRKIPIKLQMLIKIQKTNKIKSENCFASKQLKRTLISSLSTNTKILKQNHNSPSLCHRRHNNRWLSRKKNLGASPSRGVLGLSDEPKSRLKDQVSHWARRRGWRSRGSWWRSKEAPSLPICATVPAAEEYGSWSNPWAVLRDPALPIDSGRRM